MRNLSVSIGLGSLLLASACDKSNSLGEVDDAAADDGVATSGGSATGEGEGEGEGEGDGNSDSDGADDGDGVDVGDDGDDGDDGPAPGCPPGSTFAEPPGCETGTAPALTEARCYDECAIAGEACEAGETCMLVQYNPCPCPPDAEACCGACGGEITLCMPAAFDAVCGAIIGRTFLSLEELECGLSKEGPVLCNWRVAFDRDGSWLWQYSDVGEAGEYGCENGVLTVGQGRSPIDASFDPITQILTWQDVEYQAAQE